MKKTLYCTILIVTFFLIILSGCQTASQSQDTMYSMGTVMNFTVYGTNGEHAVSEAEKLVESYDAIFSANAENSELSKYNRGEEQDISQELMSLISKAEELEEKTGGAFNPYLGALTKIWGFSTEAPRLPSQDEIQEALSDSSQIDLGGITKGYLSDQIKKMWEEEGVQSAVVSLGGNVMTIGKKPDGGLWKIGIRDPFLKGNEMIGVLETDERFIITSGSYERSFEENGVTYHHILNPETGYPVDNGLVSVTVVCDSGTIGDALSTALFVMGKEEALRFWNNSEDFDLILVEEDGLVTVTEGIQEAFSAREGVRCEYIKR